MEMQHKLSQDAVRDFIFAGKALFTVVNTRTGNRLTFKVTQKTTKEGNKTPHFVSVMTGTDNLHHYSYIGIIGRGARFRTTRGSRLSDSDMRVKAFSWLWNRADSLPDFVEVWHHGRCGRCSRVLTMPESIESGLGPICASRMN